MTLQAQPVTANLGNTARGAVALLATAIIAVLSACSGDGNGGTDVTIGGGQSGDPVTLDFPVFYVKRPVPDPEADVVTDVRELRRFEPGADLFMRSSASPSSPEINLTASQTLNGRADIRDVDVDFDGQKVVFAMRVAPTGMDLEDVEADEDMPSWDIWQYDVATKELNRVITSDNVENDGHDIMPHYLPDGRIVFSSTRQRQSKAILLDENKPQYAAQVEGEGGKRPAFNLHVMDEDGENIHQLSFNQSHDLDPAVLANGQIVFTRYERAIDDNQMDLYKVNPDGSSLQLLYGANSHLTGTADPTTGTPTTIQFTSPRTMQDGRTLALIRPFDSATEGGDLILINTESYVDCNQTVPTTTVTASPPCAAQVRALPTDVRTIPGPSPGGRFRSAAPLFDGTNRLLVSWSQCRLTVEGRIVPCTSDNLANSTAEEAPPLYGVYIYDVRDNTQRPIVTPQEGFIYTEVVAAAIRELPPVILDRAPGVDFPQPLEAEGVGILHIRSVYDFDGVDAAPGGSIANVRNPANAAYAQRARFLRLERVVAQPDQDTRDVPNTAFGRGGRRFGMRDILGYAPIEPDGSVKVKVPANVPFTFSILDANGRRAGGNLGGLHTNWLQLQVGETLQCSGCHVDNANNRRAHGRAGLYTSVNQGAPTSTPFANTNAALLPNAGETMAEVRNRAMCGGACKPSMNLVFNDIWPVMPPAATDACYLPGATDVVTSPSDSSARHTCSAGLITSPLPLSDATCSANWTSRCRVTIHYPTHIQPLWDVDRPVDANADGVNDVDAMGVMINNKCSTCHMQTVNAGNQQVPPAGQLDLTSEPSEEQPDHLRSYRELLFADRAQITNVLGQLEDECIRFETDPVTNVTVCAAFRQVPASMSFNGANASNRFFTKFDAGGGTVDHRPFLNRAELKLISEWLDIGAQYYNNPFAAPED
jgi:hypothetical protein